VKKPKKFDVGKLVREIARDRIGQPPKGRTVPDKRKRKLERIREKEQRDEQPES
jgi:hypothetical protein